MSTKSPPPANRGKTRSPTKEPSRLQPAALIRLKAVVRRLPPNLPESVFWQSVQPWVTDETASWKIFYQGKLRKKLNKENIPSRAYVLFKHEEDLATFSRDYDGHVFRDKQGVESQAVVEFAPNQKAPPEKKKVDSRHATIQQDEDYLSFVSSLHDPLAKPVDVDVDALLASTIPPEEPKTTPLLAALREQKQSAQEKKIAAAETGKSHSRKGGATAPPPQKQEAADTAPPPGKKSKKGKATQAGAAAPAPPPAAPPNPPSTKPSREGKHIRVNPNSSQTQSTSTSTTAPQLSSAPVSNKDAVPSDSAEPSQRRPRPMLGLQSRHLKAALSGAGVSIPATPASPSTPSVVPAAPLAPPASGPSGNGNGNTGVGPSGSGSRGPRGRGAPEKREAGGKDSGGGRGSSKEKARSRHGHAGPGNRPPDATPRILSRQDPPPSAFGAGEPPAKDRAPSVASQESGGSRGRGGRRGRGQS